jgi:diguanylate cyclase (GGDEF)-like protein
MGAMEFQIVGYGIVHGVNAVIAAAFAFAVLFARADARRNPSLPYLRLMSYAVALWSLANALEACAVAPESKILMTQVGYVGAMLTPAFFLAFAVAFTSASRTNRRLMPLIILPLALAIVAAWTNGAHHLLWTGFIAGPPGSNSLIYVHGPLFWAIMVFVFSYSLLGSAILIAHAFGSRGFYRKRAIAISSGILAAWIPLLAYLSGLTPFPGLDSTPLSFLLINVILLRLLGGGVLMGARPVARDWVVDRMKEALIVMDDAGFLLDANAAALDFLELKSSAIGLKLDLKGNLDELLRRAAREGLPETVAKLSVDGGDERWLELTSDSLDSGRDANRGVRVILIKDVSDRVKADDALKDAYRRLDFLYGQALAEGKDLKDKAYRDSLTGVYNRRYLEEIARSELTSGGSKGMPLCVAMLDIDHFKEVNDSLGHEEGDKVLRALAAYLKSRTRSGDAIVRYGGEEFLLIFAGSGIEAASAKLEEMRSGFPQSAMAEFGVREAPSFSAGIAYSKPGRSDLDEAIRAADQALYRAKEGGRNQVRRA